MSQQATPKPAPVRLPLFHGEPHPCPYLPGRIAEDAFAVTQRLDPETYHALMDGGFRRSGRMVYKPVCRGCRECVPIRVPVETFRPSRSQRRVLRRNADVRVSIGPPSYHERKRKLFAAYLAWQHDDAMSDDPSSFHDFLYASPVDTVEMTYTVDGRLIAAGIVDVAARALSSVYFYFDPHEARRSLGVFSALCEIEECRRRAAPHWYVGFYVRACPQMNYKSRFRPYELLAPDGHWTLGI